jgi:Mlc titration factor MtfA (ptsG expression regulator)
VDDYPTLRTVVVYPRAYVVQHARRRPDGTVVEGPSARLGESWVRGEVILSWDDALRGAADPHDGHNVVLHELAHQLDSEVSGVDGAPDLGRSSRYVAWARVLGREYEALARDVARHRPTLLDPYGATAPAEFFAVATELFFERPAALRREHPELYEQLAAFYGHDRAGG